MHSTLINKELKKRIESVIAEKHCSSLEGAATATGGVAAGDKASIFK